MWLGGKYAAAKDRAYVNAAEEVTDRVNTIIKAAAANSHSYYVDLRAAFKGPDYAYDETHYLAGDGDHPNAAGHEQIAKAVKAAIDRVALIRRSVRRPAVWRASCLPCVGPPASRETVNPRRGRALSIAPASAMSSA